MADLSRFQMTIEQLKTFAGRNEKFAFYIQTLDAILGGHGIAYGDHSTQALLDKLRKFFETNCEEGCELDPRPKSDTNDGAASILSHLYVYAACHFLVENRVFAAQELLLHGWDTFNSIQNKSGRKVYKGQLAIWLVILYQEALDDTGAATRWALLTHADDALVRHTTGEGSERLRYSFGMSHKALTDFNRIIQPHGLDQRMYAWSEANRYADDMLVRFALNHPENFHLFASPTSVLEFPPNPPYLRALLNLVDDDNFRGTEKGKLLERLAAYLFLLIPGLIPSAVVSRLSVGGYR